MSVPRHLIIAPAARQDLRNIQLYTEQQWGRLQRIVYRRMLQSAMQRLTEYPSLGIAVPQISAGLHAFPVGQHVIYYRFSDDTVTVRRILNSQMDATAHLDP